MKQITFSMLSVAMMLLIGSAKAGAQVHGFGGYYDWTSKQMQADGIVRVDPKTGTKMSPLWLPNISFDNGYLTDTLGVGGLDDNSKASEASWWRSTIYLNYQAKEGNLTITKDYPVVMFKFSLPRNGVIEGDATKGPSMTIEHWWKSPYDGTCKLMTNKTGEGVNGVLANGRLDYMKVFPGFKCQQEDSKLYGRDSVKIGWEGNHSKYIKTDDGVVLVSRSVNVPATKTEGVDQQSLPTFTMAVLPDQDGEECNYIGIINYGSIEDTVSVANGGAPSRLLLDRTNIESIGFHMMFFGYKTIADCQEAPYAKVKWIKTFASYEDARNALTAANNWGDNEQEAKYSLTIGKAEMSTLVLPFDASLPEGIKAYTLNASGNQITATPVSNIEKDKPVIVCGKAGTYEFSGTQTIESMFNERTLENGSMKGVYAKTEAAEGNYVLQKHGDNAPAFYKLTESSNKTINPYRAYLTVASDAREMKLVFDDNEVTGINNVGQEGKDNDKIVYNLNGLRLSKSVKGLQIINGKKEIIK